MQPKRINAGLSVSEQITPEAVAEIETAARQVGLQAAYQPAIPGQVTDSATAGADAIYDGYGSCPLTVERGKLLPTLTWLIDGTQPSHLAWLLKERMLPSIYWQAMLRGREWMAKPQVTA